MIADVSDGLIWNENTDPGVHKGTERTKLVSTFQTLSLRYTLIQRYTHISGKDRLIHIRI